MATYVVAMGNSKGIVKRLRIETIDAAKYDNIIINLMKEKRIYIKNNKTEYTITSHGEVYSLNYGRTKKKKMLKQIKSSNEYMYVNIYYNKKLHHKSVHRLVTKAFIPNPLNLPEVNHKDGNKENNRINNLEWSTSKDNTKHAIETNLRHVSIGENASDAKIFDKTAHKICKLLEENKLGTREIADKVNVSFATVSNIKHKKAWAHISRLYDIDNHSIKSKPIKKGKLPATKVTLEQVICICQLLQDTNLSISDISVKTNIKKCKINAILYGNAWKSISSSYDFSKRRKR